MMHHLARRRMKPQAAASAIALVAASSLASGAAAPAAADGPVVVAQAVACRGDLLRCHDLPTADRTFDSVRACRGDLAELKEDARPVGARSSTIVMARCRYIIPGSRHESPGRMAGRSLRRTSWHSKPSIRR